MGKRLAVIFPGIGYHCDKPILYYSRKLAKEQEYKEIISLEYSYTEKNIRGNEKRMKEVFDVLYQQAEKLLETIDFSKYENVLFISKSVGTVISSAYAQKHKIRCKHLHSSVEFSVRRPYQSSSCVFFPFRRAGCLSRVRSGRSSFPFRKLGKRLHRPGRH